VADPREPQDRETRLPVWAQDVLADLRRKLADAEAARDAALLATDPAGSDAVLNPYADLPIGLGRETLVRFPLDRDDWLDVRRAGKSMHEPWPHRLQVMGSHPLIIRSSSSNVITVAVEDR
jgi:hypothetical protein